MISALRTVINTFDQILCTSSKNSNKYRFQYIEDHHVVSECISAHTLSFHSGDMASTTKYSNQSISLVYAELNKLK